MPERGDPRRAERGLCLARSDAGRGESPRENHQVPGDVYAALRGQKRAGRDRLTNGGVRGGRTRGKESATLTGQPTPGLIYDTERMGREGSVVAALCRGTAAEG